MHGAVLCDIDGVVRRWDPALIDDAEARNGLTPGSFRSVAFAQERLLPAITGQCTDEEWRAGIAAALGERGGAVVAEWSESAGEVVEEVLAILQQVRRTAPVLLVSNATSRLESDLARLGLLDAVDGIVNSSRVGFAKPDPEIYHHAAKLAGANVEACLFVDDTLPNVQAALAIGMAGHHYQSPDGLRGILHDHLV
ncbi:HAD family hydrolase [Tenggerimyces flavus]|uniref:HAD family hydrolase n=1 Tax=Tenggerimyces flavus TaxID=1708749 RepID=A0ABV7YB07_9ACTN|nr:HAD-IA family hydrolase [Tenggerimyces flavus]MBM7786609.1 putative hydrolase of the HAD superfamily [Tenggerimyces flavus]